MTDKKTDDPIPTTDTIPEHADVGLTEYLKEALNTLPFGDKALLMFVFWGIIFSFVLIGGTGIIR